MPDTDDDQSVELDPAQREQGDDDTEAASERRATKARAEADRRAVHELTADEDVEQRVEEDALLVEEEDEAAHAEHLEIAAKEQQELDALHDHRDALDATADVTRALNLAHADEAQRDRSRGYATTETQRSIGDLARGRHELDEAAAYPDDPGAAELGAKGRRDERASGIEDRRARSDDRLADAYDESAQEHRRDARQAQPDAIEAVRTPPGQTPEAQLPQARRHVRGPKSRQRNLQRRKPQQQNDGIDLDL